MTGVAEYEPGGLVRQAMEDPDRLSAELSQRKLRHFVKNAWHVVEPKTPYKPNFHIDAICDHLEAVDNGEIQNLLINIPPRCSKSLTVSVMWNPFRWTTNPSVRFLCASYAQPLATRDAVSSRRIIQSRWYQRHWGHMFRLTSDQNTKIRFENNKTGYRIATSVDGVSTGEGGDYLIVDDAHNVKKVESDIERDAAITWWHEVMSSRLNDQDRGGKVVMMQRSHQMDLAGDLLEHGDYEHLMLPMEYTGKCVVDLAHSCSQQKGTVLGFKDPRKKKQTKKKAGEILQPNRFSPKAVKKLQSELGSYAWASQYQQSPVTRDGNMFKVEHFDIWDEIFEDEVVKRVRAWDKAGTDGGGAYTVGVRMGIMQFKEKGKLLKLFFIDDVIRVQYSAGKREALIRSTAEMDGHKVKISIEREPGSGGLESAENSRINLAGFSVHIDNVSGEGNKEQRADPYSVAVETGKFVILRAGWNWAFIEEHKFFPRSTYKDQVDAAAQAYARLAGKYMGSFHIG